MPGHQRQPRTRLRLPRPRARAAPTRSSARSSPERPRDRRSRGRARTCPRRDPPRRPRDAGRLRGDGRAACPGCACTAPTGSRTAAGWARPRPRSSAGIVLARALVEGGAALLDDAAALALANRLEGHPDNVAPALLGGFVVSGPGRRGGLGPGRRRSTPRSRRSCWCRRTASAPRSPAACSRDAVPHADAAANTGRAALLVAALGGQPGQLLRATEDFLHQRQREPAMPESLALVHDAARARGAGGGLRRRPDRARLLVAGGLTPSAEAVARPRPGRVADTPADRRRARRPRANLSEASRPASRWSTVRSRRTPDAKPITSHREIPTCPCPDPPSRSRWHAATVS